MKIALGLFPAVTVKRRKTITRSHSSGLTPPRQCLVPCVQPFGAFPISLFFGMFNVAAPPRSHSQGEGVCCILFTETGKALRNNSKDKKRRTCLTNQPSTH